MKQISDRAKELIENLLGWSTAPHEGEREYDGSGRCIGGFAYADMAQSKLEDYIATLEAEVEALKAEHRWIPVSERLPQIGVRVLFYNSFTKNIHKGWFSCDKWTSDIGVFYNGDKFKRITHWMPLPQPPEVQA